MAYFCILCYSAGGFDRLSRIATNISVKSAGEDRAEFEQHLMLVHGLRIVRETEDGFEVERIPDGETTDRPQ